MRPTRDQREHQVMGELLRKPAAEVAKLLEEHFPQLWRRFDTKSVEAPGNFPSPKALAVALTGAVLELGHQARTDGRVHSNMGLVASILERHDFPTYHVSGPLFEAIKRSRPPKGRTWADVRLPFPGLYFALPRASLVEPEPTKCEIIGLGVAEFRRGATQEVPGLGKFVQEQEDRTCTFWVLGRRRWRSTTLLFLRRSRWSPPPTGSTRKPATGRTALPAHSPATWLAWWRTWCS